MFHDEIRVATDFATSGRSLFERTFDYLIVNGLEPRFLRSGNAFALLIPTRRLLPNPSGAVLFAERPQADLPVLIWWNFVFSIGNQTTRPCGSFNW